MSWAIWITGLPGSGKSSIARAAADLLQGEGVPVVRLELDAMRRVVTPVPTYGDAERDLVYRALVWTAAELAGAGVPVIVDATAHRREWRDLARALVARFAEVQLVCPAETCATRERAVRWGLRGCTAWAPPRDSAPDVVPAYEPSFRAELVIHTDVEGPWSAVEAVLVLARRLRDAEASAA